ncbi:DUF751 family protein [Kovacikia minuta CCNUW1]|uniref:DUF751 family protein n=1 Tax=Kovacikia minuta TaxID=2931930 RepID=UPI001CCE1702|nr:DUF751 family protein [Kovacikia minuta]UBF26821.1 DUF751 family protein [Kovacikia minuta CCNUW1]
MENLWNTVSKWPVFIFASILGVFLNAIKPIRPLLKNPVTAIALVGLLVAGFAFVAFTLRAMLGLNPV